MFEFINKVNQWLGLSPVVVGKTYIHVTELKNLADKYSIQIVAAQLPVFGKVQHESISPGNLKVAIEIIKSELTVYSPAHLKRTKLKQVVLCSALKVGQSDAHGAMRSHAGTMFFAMSDAYHHDRIYSRRSFHHELFHCIDYHDNIFGYHDPHWGRLNERGFLYSGEKYLKMPNVGASRMGFISNYSMSAVHEDKAELYAHLMMHYRDLYKIAQKDPVLAKKIEKLKALLSKFSPHYDHTFWSERHDRACTLVQQEVPLVRDELKPVILNIWRERIGANNLWFVARTGHNSKPLLFYSKQSLSECLRSLNVLDYDLARAIENVRPELDFSVKVSTSRLNRAGLYALHLKS